VTACEQSRVRVASQMLVNIAKNRYFPKTLPPTFFRNIFYTKILPFFEMPIVSIKKTIHFGLFIK